jgi:SAM-dependent methyltransferase
MDDRVETRSFLSIGSGEILPYIIRQWEPSATRVTCVDLSQRSLRRATIRTAFLGRKISFHHGDIDAYLQSSLSTQRKFQHMEAYGVLHHISGHRKTMRLMRDSLADDGLIRLMVYNSHARDWIWEINRAFVDLGLSYKEDRDVQAARNLLRQLATTSPRLHYRLEQMGSSSLDHDTRFADTFMHPWESRATIKQWFDLWKSCGLRPMALYDRYAELDDLPNPLWHCPTADELAERAQDLRFENNLEVWLCHANQAPKPMSSSQNVHQMPLRLRLTLPPSQLRRFSETSTMTWGAQLILWQGLLRSIHGLKSRRVPDLLQSMDIAQAQRLARIGLITPHAARESGLYERLLAPMTSSMSPPTLPKAVSPATTQNILSLCTNLQTNQQRINLAVQRFVRVL